MLDDEAKKIIEAEERYRHEITQKLRSGIDSFEQSALNLEHSIWGKVLEILNSNFGLWFLSSVFITGGAAMYQITQHHFEVKMSREKEVITCEFEIANRLNSMKFLIKRAKTNADAKFALTPITDSFGAVSTEYEHVNIAVLYFKVFQLTGLRNAEMEGYVKALEEKNLAIHLANPTAPFDEDERKNLLEMISALQRYESDQINHRKN
jgi:hypothetical protein